MCRSFCWIASVLLAGCTIPLDPVASAADAMAAPDLVTGCALFAETTATVGLGHSVEMPDGATLWTFEGALGTRADGIVGNFAPSTGGCPGILSNPRDALPPSAGDTDFATPLDLVRVGDDVWQFFETWHTEAGAPFGVKMVGRGVARWNPVSRQFDRPKSLLWTADRPNYGSAVVRESVWVFAYGCVPTDNGWTRACYVARAPAAQLDQSDAWQYATAVGQFTTDVDAAQPILVGVGDLSVRRHASGKLLLTYVLPLDTVLQVRSALGPTGPFSAPYPLGRCDAPVGAFCVGAVQHPEYDPAASSIAVTFARASFEVLSPDVRHPRFAILTLPTQLP